MTILIPIAVAALAAAPRSAQPEFRVIGASGECMAAPLELVNAIREAASEHELIPFERAAPRGDGFRIEFLVDPEIPNMSGWPAALEAAAAVYESRIRTPVTMVYEIDLTFSQASFIATASVRRVTAPYAGIRSLLLAGAQQREIALLAALPSEVEFVTSSGVVSASDAGGVVTTSANARAIGLGDPEPGVRDGVIAFNTLFNFDTNPSNGITPGSVDLQYFLVHELAHSLGFFSGVDSSEFRPALLDVFRLGALEAENDPATPADFSSFPREARRGVEAAIDPAGLINGAPPIMRLSTGVAGGDGRQASHWKDDSLLGLSAAIGVMDPTYVTQQLPPGFVTPADLLALSLIGWDLDWFGPCPADLTGDGLVNSADLPILLGAWGPGSGPADLNGDGLVNADDLPLLLGSWGACE